MSLKLDEKLKEYIAKNEIDPELLPASLFFASHLARNVDRPDPGNSIKSTAFSFYQTKRFALSQFYKPISKITSKITLEEYNEKNDS